MGAENHRHLFQQPVWIKSYLSPEVVKLFGLPEANPRYKQVWSKDDLCDLCHSMVVYTGDLSATNKAVEIGFSTFEIQIGSPPHSTTGIIVDFNIIKNTPDGNIR